MGFPWSWLPKGGKLATLYRALREKLIPPTSPWPGEEVMTRLRMTSLVHCLIFFGVNYYSNNLLLINIIDFSHHTITINE